MPELYCSVPNEERPLMRVSTKLDGSVSLKHGRGWKPQPIQRNNFSRDRAHVIWVYLGRIALGISVLHWIYRKHVVYPDLCHQQTQDKNFSQVRWNFINFVINKYHVPDFSFSCLYLMWSTSAALSSYSLSLFLLLPCLMTISFATWLQYFYQRHILAWTVDSTLSLIKRFLYFNPIYIIRRISSLDNWICVWAFHHCLPSILQARTQLESQGIFSPGIHLLRCLQHSPILWAKSISLSSLSSHGEFHTARRSWCWQHNVILSNLLSWANGAKVFI